jgi:hypothetical protein
MSGMMRQASQIRQIESVFLAAGAAGASMAAQSFPK